MAIFDEAIGAVLEHEGGYSCDPRDRGAETNYGISKRQYPDLAIKNLTIEDAKRIYRRDYWQYNSIEDQPIATKVFDLAVHMGHELLQVALNGLGKNVAVDGVFGPDTLAATNHANPQKLLLELRAQAAAKYARIVLADPSQQAFLLGWMRRAVS